MRECKKRTPQTPQHKSAIGLRSAANIMERWGASQDQMTSVLRVSQSTLTRARNESCKTLKLDTDQLDRISYVLNIHAALKVIFENAVNVYGFMSMPNGNEFFNGRDPLEVIADGSFASLYETFRRLDGLRGGGW